MDNKIQNHRWLTPQWAVTLTLIVLSTIIVLAGSILAETDKYKTEQIAEVPALVSTTPYDDYAFGYDRILGQAPELDWVKKQIDPDYEKLKAEQIGIDTTPAVAEQKTGEAVKRVFRGVAVMASPIKDLSDQDYEALLRIVQAEAGGEDAIGKILVANVVLNRVKSNQFPHSVYDVVHQVVDGEAQFSPITNGAYDRVKISKATIDAVAEALGGVDYSEGAMFFRKVNTSGTPNWHQTHLKALFVHGHHEFFTYK